MAFHAVTIDPSPFPLWHHVGLYHMASKKIFLFGGQTKSQNLQKERNLQNCLYVLSAVMCKFTSPTISGTAPPPIKRHAGIILGEKIWIFGGKTKDSILNDLFVLSLDTYNWAHPQVSSEPPKPRYGHAAIAIDETRFFVFGGKNDTQCFNDQFLFDSVKMEWLCIDKGDYEPSPRSGHSMVLYQNKILLFGGYDGTQWLNDFHIFDLTSYQWSMIDSWHPPSPRSDHASFVHNNHLIIFGGRSSKSLSNKIYAFDIDSMEWKRYGFSGMVPGARYGHIFVEGRTRYHLLGGYDSNNSIMPYYIINKDRFSQDLLRAQTPPPTKQLTYRQLYLQEKSYRIKLQVKCTELENRLLHYQSLKNNFEMLSKQLMEKDMEIEYLEKKIQTSKLKNERAWTESQATDVTLDLMFLWKRHEQYIKSRDEINQLISGSERAIKEKLLALQSSTLVGSVLKPSSSMDEMSSALHVNDRTSPRPTGSQQLQNHSPRNSDDFTEWMEAFDKNNNNPIINTSDDLSPNDPQENLGELKRPRPPSISVNTLAVLSSPDIEMSPRKDKKKDKKERDKKEKIDQQKAKKSSKLKSSARRFTLFGKKKLSHHELSIIPQSPSLLEVNSPQSKVPELIKPKPLSLNLMTVQKCCDYLMQHLICIGIFRLSDTTDKIASVYSSFEGDPELIDLSEVNSVHAVSGAFKLFLREATSPVFPFVLYEAAMNAGRLVLNENDFSAMQEVIRSLPELNYEILSKVVHLLFMVAQNSSKNKMDAKNLSIIFGPTLLRPEVETLESLMLSHHAQCDVVKVLIENFNVFFPTNITDQPTDKIN